MIEARIVEANDTFSRNLGSRLGFRPQLPGRRVPGADWQRRADSRRRPANTGCRPARRRLRARFHRQLARRATCRRRLERLAAPGQFSFILFNSSGTRFLNLELSALEADGKGKIISSPRVLTADQVEALIEQGTEIPYQQATSSGATAVRSARPTWRSR